MNDFLQNHKNHIISILKGYDISLKAKGVTLFSIVQDIERDTSISEEEIRRKYSMFYNKAMLGLRRNNQKAKIEWLNSNNAVIMKHLYIYSKLCSSVYKFDDSLISWYKSNSTEDDWSFVNENDLGHFLFSYGDNIYSAEVLGSSSGIGRHISVSNVWNAHMDKDVFVTYDFNHETIPDGKGDIAVLCNNTSCPRWKQSLASPYKDDAKNTNCSIEDCSKCEGFTKCGVLRPMDALFAVLAIYKCMLTREHSTHSHLDEQVYEHIPLPQRVDDVIIYFGEPKKPKSLKDIGLVPVSDMKTGIISSHASPREHHRRGGTRRAYTRKDGVKVKETTFKETIVNKGYDKTTYKLKKRS